MKRGEILRTGMGVVLVVFGLNWLAVNFGWDNFLARIDWEIVWPAIPLFAGLSIFSWKGAGKMLFGLAVTILGVVVMVMRLFGMM